MQNIFDTHPFPYYVYEKKIQKLQTIALKKIRHFYKLPIRFVRFFGLFAALQFLSLFIIKEPLLIGFILGLFFISLFSFVSICQLIHKKAHAKSHQLIKAFMNQCKMLASSLEDPLAEHLVSIQGLDMLINQFDLTSKFFPKWFYSLEKIAKPILSKYEANFYAQMIEVMLQHKSQHIIKMISIVPDEISFHAKLALCFMQKAKHFTNQEEKELMTQAYQCAIDEIKIVESFLVDKNWAYQKLAFCYEKLEQYDELIAILEKIHFLKPDDSDILKKLATLYFRFNKRAKGLEIYEKLRYNHPEIGKELIQIYSEQL